MASSLSLDPAVLLASAGNLAVAFLLGTLIGAERQYRQRTAGLRTNVLVAVGAATFVDLGARLNAQAGATQVLAYVVSGIGFLGAGVIMKEGLNVRGLNTAATLWCSAAVGAACGTGFIAEAALLTVAVLAGNTLLRPLVNAINRIPIDERASEATYEVRLTTDTEHVAQVRDALDEALERANYPVREIEVEERGEDEAELVATLVSTAVEPAEIETVVAELQRRPDITHASWAARTSD